MGENKVTIYDIAEAAEVGIGTVSRVLNDNDNVSDKTREKVFSIIEELNYHPNGLARGLALQKTDSIGVIVPSFTGHFFVEVLRGVQQVLDELELDLVLFNIDKEQKEEYINRILKERKVDGILGITLDLTPTEVQEFQDRDLPLVLVDDYQDNVDSIFVDEIAGVKKAINYLFELGHQNIAFFDGPITSTHGKNRLQGVKEAFQNEGLEFTTDLLKKGQFTTESGYKTMQKILKSDRQEWPTAIFAASDNQAIGALEAIEEEGLTVPDDFAMVGYDDIELARYLNLTTVRQPMFKMGQLGVETLVDLISNQQHQLLQKEIVPELIIRESC